MNTRGLPRSSNFNKTVLQLWYILTRRSNFALESNSRIIQPITETDEISWQFIRCSSHHISYLRYLEHEIWSSHSEVDDESPLNMILCLFANSSRQFRGACFLRLQHPEGTDSMVQRLDFMFALSQCAWWDDYDYDYDDNVQQWCLLYIANKHIFQLWRFNQVFWDTMPYWLGSIYWHSGGPCCLLLQDPHHSEGSKLHSVLKVHTELHFNHGAVKHLLMIEITNHASTKFANKNKNRISFRLFDLMILDNLHSFLIQSPPNVRFNHPLTCCVLWHHWECAQISLAGSALSVNCLSHSALHVECLSLCALTVYFSAILYGVFAFT